MNKKTFYILVAIAIILVGVTLNHLFCDCKPNNESIVDLKNNNHKKSESSDISFSTVKSVSLSDKKNKGSKLSLEASKSLKDKDIKDESIKKTTTNFEGKAYIFNFQIGESFASLKKPQKQKLIEIYKIVKGTDLKVSIIGHTDSFGKSSSNLILGKKRADHLKNQLLTLGLSKNQVISSSKGESEPIATNNTENGRIKNRRIEITIK